MKCNSCEGKGYQRGLLVPIKFKCPICDGSGCIKELSGEVDSISMDYNDAFYSTGYGMKTIKDINNKPHYKYNWKTGKAELVG